jgi:hypothetical protein
LIKGTYNFRLAISYNNATGYDTATVNVIDETNKGQEFIFESAWVLTNDIQEEIEAATPNRPGLFSNPNQLNIRPHLHKAAGCAQF